MKIIRFIFPFLFVRNWYDGNIELSRTRLVFFGIFLCMLSLGIAVVYYLQAPMVYSAPIL